MAKESRDGSNREAGDVKTSARRSAAAHSDNEVQLSNQNLPLPATAPA